ncbi:MAG: hypothetical protein M1823_001305 [Watsoniomyces obsoletus]|nr:MAG: hypothetical protein M1823_001305 [Watsoniomyces obsoletus]
MPAAVDQATFVPIPPDYDIEEMVETTPNFEWVPRISCDMIDVQGVDAFEKLVLLHVVLGGKPLVIEGFEKRLPTHLFSASWLKDNLGDKYELARDLGKQTDIKLSMTHYLKSMSHLAEQITEETYQDSRRQRIYFKDIDCPEAWRTYLRDLLPPSLFYLNESTREGSIPNTSGCEAAPAGDLMSSLPPDMRAQNLMCYIGHEGTYTPAHREMCASLGQNIMVETSGDGLDPWGQREKPGSSVWFMTETKDRFLVSEYWLSILGHDIEVESYFAQVPAWSHAPFTTYIVEQRVGDFLLIPPLAPHQVWNRGTRTMKVAWNRTTVETLEMALNEALPRARMVCRDEQYKNKAIIYFTLMKYADLLNLVDEYSKSGWSAAALHAIETDRKIRQLRNDFRSLFKLFSQVLLTEMFADDQPKEKNVEYLPFESNVTCAYCRCNIFNRFLTCKTCIIDLEDGDQDTYDVCMECYAMGRSCGCISKLKWVEQFPWSQLTSHYEQWRNKILEMKIIFDESNTPPSIAELRQRYPKKTLAQVCQEQLKIRPWHDITKPLPTRSQEQGIDEGTDDDDDGEDDTPRKRRKRRRVSGKAAINNTNCHICKKRDANWKLARCQCGTAYCYGTLFRAFDLMPLEVMEQMEWSCPKCQGICSCGACRREGGTKPHQPTGTLVGHDTKRIADPRSVESLVDFGRSNLGWLDKTTDPDELAPAHAAKYETVRLRRFREKAEREKAEGELRNATICDEDMELAPVIHETGTTPGGYSQEAGRAGMDDFDIDPALTAGDFRYLDSEPGPYSNSPTPFSQQDHDALDESADNIRPSDTMLPSPSDMLGGVPAPRQNESVTNQGSKRKNASKGKGVQKPPQASNAPQAPAPYMAPIAPMMSGPLDDNDAPGSSEDSRPPTGSTPALPLNPEEEPGHAAGPPGWSQSTEPPAYNHSPAFEHEYQHQGGKTVRGSEVTANNTAVADANREFEKARKRQMLNDAKKNDSFTMTQARLSGKHKVISLPLQKEHLEQLKPNEPEQEHSQSDVRGDGADDAKPSDNTFLVVSDAPKEMERPRGTESTLADAQMDGGRDRAPPKLFGSRKKKGGRPSKDASANVTNQRLFSRRASKKSEKSENSPETPLSQSLGRSTGRRESVWLARKRGAEDQEYPSELPRKERKKRVLHHDDNTGGFSGIDVSAGPHKESSGLFESETNKRDKQERETVVLSSDESVHADVLEVDDDYQPIPKARATSSKNGSTGGSFSQLYQDEALNKALSGELSSTSKPKGGRPKQQNGGQPNNATNKKRAHERSSDPYHDAKMMALRIAEGEVTDIGSASGSGSDSEFFSDEDHHDNGDDGSPAQKKMRMMSGTVKPGSYLRHDNDAAANEMKGMRMSTGRMNTLAAPSASVAKKGGPNTVPRSVSSSKAAGGASLINTSQSKRVSFNQQSIMNRPGMKGKRIKIVSETRTA